LSGDKFAVVAWIITIDAIAKHLPIEIILQVSETSPIRQIPHQKAAFLEVKTKLHNTSYLT
jgi:hypothetical protein